MNNQRRTFLRILPGLLLSFLIVGSAAPVFAQQPSPTPAPDQAATPKIYLPLIVSPSNSLYVGNLEVTQAVQNISNPVKLVANRPTTVRVYPRTIGSSQVSNITATLSAYRGGSLLGQLSLTGGVAYPTSTSLNTLRADSTMTFNFSIPAGWMSSGTTLLVANLSTSGGGSTSNNYSQSLSFNTVPQLNVVAVPIRLMGTYGPPDTSYIQEALFRMYPVPSVNVSVHSTYVFNEDPSYDSAWDDLLGEMTTLRDAEVGTDSSTVYYGVIPLRDGSGNTWFPVYSGGVVGYGWVGDRVSIGVSNETFKVPGYPGEYGLGGDDTAAHEIGHNLGRYHTYGCGAGNTDPNYPYENGIIGQFGFKYSDHSVVPNTYNDIMNYCTDQWVSDYTYQGLYDDQVQSAYRVSLPMQESMLVRANLASDGSVELLPVYNLSTSPSVEPEVSEYSIQLLDGSGNVITETSANVVKAEEKQLSTMSIHAALPVPDKPVSEIRLMHNGQEVSSRLIAASAAKSVTAAPALTEDGGQLHLKWGLPGAAAMVRMTTDGGATWTTLGVDVKDGELAMALDDLPSGTLQFQILIADSGETLTASYNR